METTLEATETTGMNFDYNENQIMIAQSIKDFADREIRPDLMKWDEEQYFPKDLFHKMGELGFMGVFVPEKYNGAGFGYFEYVTVVSEIAKVCGSIGLSVAAHNSLCTGHIYYHGTEEQKKKYLPKLATGQWLGAWALTEPNTGSDAMRMKVTAKKVDGGYILNGTKNWITHGVSSDVVVAIVRTGEVGDTRGMTAFIVERGTKGLLAGKKENKLGMRASETAQVIFEDCFVPDEQVVGGGAGVGNGFQQAMQVLDGGRISIAALGLGIAKGAYDASVKYAKEREQFGQPIGNFQAIAFKLADMATKIEAGELLTMQAAYLKNEKRKMSKESAFAKYYTSEIAVEISTDAVQIFGGYGYTKDYPVEKFYRDSKLCTIGEGTSEVQKLVISREIMKGNI
ncbi:MAG TPA: acyl-CoA dehydrogenase family protein [Chitinophagales bacterium]|nr:acyl-CoA dehydrogenase family protein [Chitinophagales bacterium]